MYLNTIRESGESGDDEMYMRGLSDNLPRDQRDKSRKSFKSRQDICISIEFRYRLSYAWVASS